MRFIAAAIALCIVHASALAQSYPAKPIRIVVGFSGGSTTDLLARTLGQKMSEAWGQPVVVENRPSAGGVVASSAVANAEPDGYTLLLVSAGHAATAAIPEYYASSNGVRRSFCRKCGASLTYENEQRPDEIDVLACALADPAAVHPEAHIFVAERLPWFDTADQLPRYQQTRRK